MSLSTLYLKKGEDKRLREGHVWIFSNEIDNKKSPLKNFQPGDIVNVESYQGKILGSAYINPYSLIAARLFSRNQEEELDTAFFTKRIAAALTLRERLCAKPFYRLVFGESDDLPGLIIDRYNQHFVVQCNTTGIDIKKSQILLTLQQIFPDLKSLIWRNDSSVRQQENLLPTIEVGFGQPPDHILLEENNASFYVPLLQGQKTGWFFDHTQNRTRLKSYVQDQRVLDVFSYLGAWGIQAAMLNAESIHCIDSSTLACEWIHKNAALNAVQKKVHTICEDAVIGLNKLHQAKLKFDVIILDPPAFIKKRKDQTQGKLAYQRINALALRLLEPQGILISSSCSMHLPFDDFNHLIHRASIQSQCVLQLLERGHQNFDHPIHLAIPETEYLKMSILRRI